MENKKKQSEKKNYTEEEKCVLKNLLRKKPILYSRATQKAGNQQEKRKAWEWVAAEFSRTEGCSERTADSLMKLFSNMKAKRKTELAKEKRQFLSTGNNIIIHHPDEDPDMDMLENQDMELRGTPDSDYQYVMRKSVSQGTPESHTPAIVTNATSVQEQAPSKTNIPCGSQCVTPISKPTTKSTVVVSDSIARQMTEEIVSDEDDIFGFDQHDKVANDALENDALLDRDLVSEEDNNKSEKHASTDGKRVRAKPEVTYTKLLKKQEEDMDVAAAQRNAEHLERKEALKAKRIAQENKAAYYAAKLEMLRQSANKN